MKDKLVKNNRTKSFYRIRFAGKAFAFASILSLSAAMPIIIAANASAKEANAQEAVSSTEPEIDVDSQEYEVGKAQ